MDGNVNCELKRNATSASLAPGTHLVRLKKQRELTYRRFILGKITSNPEFILRGSSDTQSSFHPVN